VYLYGDSNVLINGREQTQVLLKTVIIDGFPEKIESQFASLKVAADVERSMQQSVGFISVKLAQVSNG